MGDVLEIAVIGAGKVQFDRTLASVRNRSMAERHGWVQRLCDRAAIPTPKRPVGMSDLDWAAAKRAHTQAKYEAINELAEYYVSGDVEWRMVGGKGDGGLLLTALCRLKPQLTAGQVQEFINSRTKEGMAKVRADKRVVQMMNQIRIERAGDVDASDELDELDNCGFLFGLGRGDKAEDAE